MPNDGSGPATLNKLLSGKSYPNKCPQTGAILAGKNDFFNGDELFGSVRQGNQGSTHGKFSLESVC